MAGQLMPADFKAIAGQIPKSWRAIQLDGP
jgi:hypothetical protein